MEKFMQSRVKVKTNDDAYCTGTLLSIDGYLNVVLHSVVLRDAKLPAAQAEFRSMFIKGSNVEYISLLDSK